MAKEPALASEDDIRNVILADGHRSTQRRICRNLYLLISKSGKKSFRYRLSSKGKERSCTLGDFPEMSLQEALKIWAHRERERRRKHQNWRDSVFKDYTKKLEGLDRKVEPCSHPRLRGPRDFNLFVRNLFAEAEPTELYLAIWLHILLPVRPYFLLSARWDKFFINQEAGQYSWRWEVENGKPEVRDIYLSNHTTDTLKKLYELTGTTEFLFPRLTKENNSVRNEILQVELDKLWKPYQISIHGFREIFRSVLTNAGHFSVAFIDSLCAPEKKKSFAYDHGYLPQRRAVAEWWDTIISLMTPEANPETNKWPFSASKNQKRPSWTQPSV